MSFMGGKFIKTNRFSFSSKGRVIFTTLIVLVSFIQLTAQEGTPSEDKTKLVSILDHSKEYCQRLGKAALDYVCLESISEKFKDTIYYVERAGTLLNRSVEREIWKKNTFVYDYQFIRKNNRLTEKRILIEEDGRKTDQEETRLKTETFSYKNVMFGPINILDVDRQSLFDYSLMGSEKVLGESALIIQAKPKPEVETGTPWGRVWVNERFYTILKIEWSQETMSRTQVIKNRAKKMKGRPKITQTTEFGFEKNGIRFPSRFTIEEAYIKKNGKKVLTAELHVNYKDYRFFTVETDIKYNNKNSGCF